MNGAAEIALVGAAVGAVLTFSLSQVDARLRRRRQGRAAARLIWYELMGARAVVRELKQGRVFLGDPPFSTHAWRSEQTAFTEVADAYAFAVVGLAYDQVEGLQRNYSELAKVAESKGTSLHELADARGSQFLGSLSEHCFDALEKALVQVDRYSGLATGPVDYAELDEQSGLRR